jgi:hypothetical protein
MDNALSGGTAEDESNASGYDPPQPTVIIDLPEGIFSLDDHCKRTGIGPLVEFLDTDEVSGRLTLMVFASDDAKAIESVHQVLNTFGGQADYILVENPAVFTSDKFKTLRLYTHFLESSAPKIVVPHIPAFSSEAMFVCLTDALKDPALTHSSFLQISAARDCLFYQFEDCASFLVPDVSLIKNKGAAA